MKLSNITNTLKDFAGNDIFGIGGPITYKEMLIQCIGTFFSSPNAEENLQAYSIGQSIYKADYDITLDDKEFKLLERAVDKALKDQRYSAIAITQLLNFMETATVEE